jgi:hypothetical protein
VSVEAVQLVGGALGGALASSVLGPLISQRRERRDVRADVLRAFGAVERTRWAPRERDEFREAVIDLRSSALVAGVDRRVAEAYLQLAQVARRMSENAWEQYPDEEFGGAISSLLGNVIRDAAEMLSEVVWHPHRTRLRTRERLRSLGQHEAALQADKDEGDIPWQARDLI